MSESYKPTAKQAEAQSLVGGDATHCMVEGGSRSGKTFLICRVLALRALAAPGARQAIFRFRFNAVKLSIGFDTFPKMMALCFPGVPYELDRTDWFFALPGGSQVWLGGLDDKDRTEKVLGQEFVGLFLNECSQIPWSARNVAVTRLAQVVTYDRGGEQRTLRPKMYYDCNPPSQAHWTYKLFHKKVEPDTGKPVANPHDYAHILLNPRDNLANLPAGYLATLEALPARAKARFLDGKYGDITEGALWSLEMIDANRWGGHLALPDMLRVVVAVDPSGADDDENAGNDEIGIIVAGLGTDGAAYVLEDLTLKAGPKTWGNVATTAFDRHQADKIVAEKNFGGEMVRFVLQTAKPGVPVKVLTASRGKAVRAEPISALTEQGKIRFAGDFPRLEDELCSMTTAGYLGTNSPNRADAFVWAMSELFPGMVKPDTKPNKPAPPRIARPGGWMR